MVAHGPQAIPIASAARAAVDVATLGRFAISGPGVPPAAGTERPLALLKLVIALGGQAVSAAQASDALWPDADGHAAHRALITNLQRLRRIIGQEAVALRGGRLSLDPEKCRVDALHLPARLDAIAAARESDALLRHTRALLGLYRGRFLPGDFDPPEIVATRARLHARFVHAVVSAGERLAGGGRSEEAVELMRAALEIDDRAEAIYRALLRACVHLARWSDGVEVFDRCREALREFHGVSPSPETVKLYRMCAERGGVAHEPGEAESPPVAATWEEQRRITVLFVAMPEDRPVARRRCEETVVRYGGTLQHSTAETVLAVFGAPVSHEDDAERAVRAARTLVLEAAAAGLPNPRIAVESGTAIVRRSAEEMHLEGEPLREVRRLSAMAGPGMVVVGRTARDSVADYFACEPLTGQGASAWRVEAETGAETHFAVSRQRGLAPFLGRQGELARLRAGLRRASSGEGGVILVSGEPGIGKSRLLYEFAAAVDGDEALVVEAACRAYGERTPYDPFVQAVRALFALDAFASPERQAHEVANRLREYDPGLVRSAGYFQRLLSLPVTQDDGGAPLATGATLRRLTKEAIGALVAQASRRRTLVLVLEDWHWSDESSDEVLRHLQSLVPAHRVLIVLSQRSAYPLRGLEPAGLEIVRLGPLADAEGLDLVRNRLGAAQVSEQLARLVQQRAGGNPFFIEEICHGLRFGTSARNGLPALDGDLAIPETVQGMIRNRLDDFDRGARDVALSAAVIGREFSLRLLLDVHEDREGLEDALDRLKAHDVLHQVGVLPEVGYRFKHALTQVVAYEILSPARRRVLHARTGAAIERLQADHVDEHVETLARHFVAAEDAERAVRYLELAGDKAARAHATGAAIGQYRQAIELLDARAPAPQDVRRRIDLSGKWAAVTHYVSAHESLEVLGRSLALARDLADRAREARTLYWIGRTHHLEDRPADALPCFRRALALTRGERGADIAPEVHACIGRAVFIKGDLPEAVRELEKALSGLDFAKDPAETIYSTSYLALALSQQGAFDRCFAVHEEAVRLARAAGDRIQEASALLRVAISRVAMGDWPGTIEVASETAIMAERLENTMTAGWAAFHEGQARFMLGERDRGIARCERGLEMVEASGARLGFCIFLASLANLYALAGDRERATASAARAFAHRRGGAHLGLYFAHHALALVAEQGSPGDARLARSRLATAHRLSLASGAWPAVAIGRLRKAELESRQGTMVAARAALREAIERFDSLGMAWWLGEARRLEATLGSR